MDDILDPSRHACVVYHVDQPPLCMVNKVGLPHVTLPTFLNFRHLHAFWDGGLGMVWDSKSSHMEKPNGDENEQAMSFHNGTIVVPDLLKGTSR